MSIPSHRQGGASSQGSPHQEAPLGADVVHQCPSVPRGLSAGTTSTVQAPAWGLRDPEGWEGPLRYLVHNPDLEQYSLYLQESFDVFAPSIENLQ